MGTLLVIIGLGWALLGVFNLIEGIQRLNASGFGDTAKGFALIFNMVALILPGLGVAGIGQGLRRRKRRAASGPSAAPTADTMPCPFCAETIKRAATVCRYCQRDLPVANAPSPVAEFEDTRESSPAVPSGKASGRRLWVVAGVIVLVLWLAASVGKSSVEHAKTACGATDSNPETAEMVTCMKLKGYRWNGWKWESAVADSAVAPRASTPQVPSPANVGAKLQLNVQKAEYEYGYFKVVGVATNIGDGAASSPTIVLEVFDSKTGQTRLGQDSGYPSGYFMNRMEPGASAAFQLSAVVPGEPSQVKWTVYAKEYPYERIGKWTGKGK